MSIWKARAVRNRILAVMIGVLAGSWFVLCAAPAPGCSCSWRGPFLTVAGNAPLVVRGRVLRHHPGTAPTMEVLALEVLAGGLLDSGLVIQMGDGMHCRPAVENFPPGSEWVLALNGPGSKPASGLALSHCGEYWLRIRDGAVEGSIDGREDQTKRMPWAEFRRRFLYPRFREAFAGRIAFGQRFRKPFGSRFEFILEPSPMGWQILVREFGREEDLARLTPPLHFLPNPREIEGWHFAADPSACSTRAHAADAGPSNPRRFIFSPEVGQAIAGDKARRSPTQEDMEDIRRFGGGVLTVGDFRLEPGNDGCPVIAWMEFSVLLEGGY